MSGGEVLVSQVVVDNVRKAVEISRDYATRSMGTPF